MSEEIEGAAAVRRAISITGDDRRDCREGNTQFFGHNLAVRGKGRTLAEIALSRADQDRVVGMNLDPGTAEGGIERVHEHRRFWWVAFEKLRPNKPESDSEDAACFDELTPR